MNGLVRIEQMSDLLMYFFIHFQRQGARQVLRALLHIKGKEESLDRRLFVLHQNVLTRTNVIHQIQEKVLCHFSPEILRRGGRKEIGKRKTVLSPISNK